MSYKTVAISEVYDDKLEELKKKLNWKSKGSLVENMISYFDTLGIDPRELNANSFDKQFSQLKNDVSKLRETTVSFIKEQEKGILKPLVQQVTLNNEKIQSYFEHEAITKKDLIRLESLIHSGSIGSQHLQTGGSKENQPSPEGDKNYSEELENLKEKAEIVIKYSKDLFRDFLKTGKKLVGRGVSFDESVINNYKAEFERLKLNM
ncbi:MAG: BfmA/BtgA family mobilization protein [Bacteroidota bacterium]|nr:BfmA/BtgA family mobilization protein [Bacteroidota bacterium]